MLVKASALVLLYVLMVDILLGGTLRIVLLILLIQKVGKIVALGVVDKKSSYHPEESFESSSNMMETEALERALNQFEPNTLKNVTCVVFDGNN